jgi:hypothetical protein
MRLAKLLFYRLFSGIAHFYLFAAKTVWHYSPAVFALSLLCPQTSLPDLSALLNDSDIGFLYLLLYFVFRSRFCSALLCLIVKYISRLF